MWAPKRAAVPCVRRIDAQSADLKTFGGFSELRSEDRQDAPAHPRCGRGELELRGHCDAGRHLLRVSIFRWVKPWRVAADTTRAGLRFIEPRRRKAGPRASG